MSQSADPPSLTPPENGESVDSLVAAVAGALEPRMATTALALHQAIEVGARLGRYTLVRELGRGGMGLVWEAAHAVSGRRVALKIVRNFLPTVPHIRERFAREARLAAAVRHPGVVPIHDVFETEHGLPVLVMDLLEGETLGDRLRRTGKLPVGEALEIVAAIADTVRAAHEAGVVHRDLKPDNVFLCASGTSGPPVRVLDFGIAKLVTDAAGVSTLHSLTQTGHLLGTPRYMAPEQLLGECDVDGRADVWALGVLLYECLSGSRPVDGDNVGQIVRRLSLREVVPLCSRAPHVPAELARVVDSMLEIDRDRRARDVNVLLARLRAGPISTAPDVPAASSRDRRFVRRMTAVAGWGVPAVMAASLAVFAIDATQSPREDLSARAATAKTVPKTTGLPALTIAAQVPKTSPWGRILDVWSRSVLRRTAKRVDIELRWPGGSRLHDDDGIALNRLRSGQVDGAMLGAESLSKIDADAAAVQLPGFVTSWPKVDWVREHFRPSLDQAFSDRDYRVLAWQDVGCARLMTRGTTIRRPSDLAHRHLATAEDEPFTSSIASVIPGSIPVTLQPSPAGNALELPSHVTIFGAAATAEEARRDQWSRWLDHAIALPVACKSGALVVRRKALERLSADEQSVVSDFANRLETEGNARARQADTATSLHLMRELSPIDLTNGERAEWQRIFRKAGDRYAQGVLSRDVVARVQELTSEIDELW